MWEESTGQIKATFFLVKKTNLSYLVIPSIKSYHLISLYRESLMYHVAGGPPPPCFFVSNTLAFERDKRGTSLGQTQMTESRVVLIYDRSGRPVHLRFAAHSFTDDKMI